MNDPKYTNPVKGPDFEHTFAVDPDYETNIDRDNPDVFTVQNIQLVADERAESHISLMVEGSKHNYSREEAMRVLELSTQLRIADSLRYIEHLLGRSESWAD